VHPAEDILGVKEVESRPRLKGAQGEAVETELVARAKVIIPMNPDEIHSLESGGQLSALPLFSRQAPNIRNIRVEDAEDLGVKINVLFVGLLRTAVIQENVVALRRANVNDVFIPPNVVGGVVQPKDLMAINPTLLEDNMHPGLARVIHTDVELGHYSGI
jgi:hypothetical protein